MERVAVMDVLYDDWVVTLLIVSFVLFSITVGSDLSQVEKSLRSMFNFKKSDGQLVYTPLSLFGLILATLHSALSTGILVYIYRGQGVAGYSETPLQSVLSLSLLVLLYIVAKIVLYIIANAVVCSKYYMPAQHFRWSSFYIMVNAVLGAVALLLSLSVIYLKIPLIIALFFYVSIAILLEIGVLFTLFSAFFKKKCSKLVFFIYLCALEIAPCFLMWFL